MKNNTNKYLKGMASRFSATVVLFLMGCLASFAGVNVLTIEDFDIAPGQSKTLEILLNNEDPVSSLQFDICFPTGLTYVDKSIAKVTSRVTRSSHSLMMVQQPKEKEEDKDRYRAGLLSTSSSTQNSAIKGNTGAILTLDVTAASDYKGGEIEIKNIIGSDATKEVPVRLDMDEQTVWAGVHVADVYSTTSSDLTVRPGEQVSLNVSLKNIIDVVGLQAVVNLPEGVNFIKDEDGEISFAYSDRLSDNVVAKAAPLSEKPGTYMLVVSSLTSDVFEGTDGSLFSLNLTCDKGFRAGEVTISDFKISSINAVSYDLTGQVLTTSLTGVSDPSGDGIWNVIDLTMVGKAYMNNTFEAACDLNNDGVVNVIDYTMASKKVLEQE